MSAYTNRQFGWCAAIVHRYKTASYSFPVFVSGLPLLSALNHPFHNMTDETHVAETVTAIQRRPTFNEPAQPTKRSTATNTNTVTRATSRNSQISNRRSLLRALTMPEKPVGQAPPLWKGIRAIITMSCSSFTLHSIPRATYSPPHRVECSACLRAYIRTFIFAISHVSSHALPQWACHFALSPTDKHDTLIFVCAFFVVPIVECPS